MKDQEGNTSLMLKHILDRGILERNHYSMTKVVQDQSSTTLKSCHPLKLYPKDLLHCHCSPLKSDQHKFQYRETKKEFYRMQKKYFFDSSREDANGDDVRLYY